MERAKYLLIPLFLLYFVSLGDNKNKVYNAYVRNRMDEWKKIIDSLDKVSNKSNQLILELVNYQYGFIAWCLSNDKKKMAEKYLKKAINYINKLESEKFKLSEVYSYKSAFIGFEIAINPWKAPFIGSNSIEFAKYAISLDSLNYLAFIQLGNAEYYRPKILGGSREKALKYYIKALQIMEKNLGEIKNDWNYINLLTTIGKIYLELSDYENSRLYFEKVLKIEPNFLWVKNELYPELLNKMRRGGYE